MVVVGADVGITRLGEGNDGVGDGMEDTLFGRGGRGRGIGPGRGLCMRVELATGLVSSEVGMMRV